MGKHKGGTKASDPLLKLVVPLPHLSRCFPRELRTGRTDPVRLVLGSPGGLELLIPDVVVLGRPSGDEYQATLEDGNVAGDNGLPGVMVTRAAGVCGTIAASCELDLVEIRTVLGRLCPCMSTNCGPRRPLGVVASAPGTFAPSRLLCGSVSLPGYHV